MRLCRATTCNWRSRPSSVICRHSGNSAASPPIRKAGVFIPRSLARTWASTPIPIPILGVWAWSSGERAGWLSILVFITNAGAGKRRFQYLTENTPNPDSDIRKAIERYIVYPGQATAYMIGKLKILELRERAQKQLGSKFTMGDFHDVILKSGPVPLNVMEERVNSWIAASR